MPLYKWTEHLNFIQEIKIDLELIIKLETLPIIDSEKLDSSQNYFVEEQIIYCFRKFMAWYYHLYIFFQNVTQ